MIVAQSIHDFSKVWTLLLLAPPLTFFLSSSTLALASKLGVDLVLAKVMILMVLVAVVVVALRAAIIVIHPRSSGVVVPGLS